jgi:adenine-specific DNA-methyltransferase
LDLLTPAHLAGRAFTAELDREEQKAAGQFMTPPDIARFMARRLVAGLEREEVTVLEPAAGSGVLVAAVVEALLALPKPPQRIALQLYEIDDRLVPGLRALCRSLAAACRQRGEQLRFSVHWDDFLLSELGLSGQPLEGLLTIANPPFFKLNKAEDKRARLHAYAVHGQPNVYGLFMAATARLTPPGGRWSFIVPRSWMAGAYFKAVRHTMLRHLQLRGLRAFESRRASFRDDAVLQETVIAWAEGRALEPSAGAPILFSRSEGVGDLIQAAGMALRADEVVSSDEQAMVSLPRRIEAGLDAGPGAWRETLDSLGLNVSTGPVVAFRAREHLAGKAGAGTVPLLWLQHVAQQRIRWPVGHRAEHFVADGASAWQLLPNAPMVVMRRFSPKEDPRRVTCAPYLGELPGPSLALENHLNYIHRPGGRMTEIEVRGLAALLASAPVDEALRASAGSTQVNATDLRRLRLPGWALIEAIGRAVPVRATLEQIDNAVAPWVDRKSLRARQAA